MATNVSENRLRPMMNGLRDLVRALSVLSRLPIPRAEGDIRKSLLWLSPLAGAALGLAIGLIFVAGFRYSLPDPAAALLALGFGAALSGGASESGLAGVADSFGREGKRQIVQDGRIGALGAVALILSFGLRAEALASIAPSAKESILAMTAAGALSRAGALTPFLLTTRAQDAGDVANRKNSAAPWLGILLALPFAFLPVLSGFSHSTCLAALAAATAGALGLSLLARVLIGGPTGATAGAAQQIAEIAALLVFSATA
jgi:adenosylcobinamide-GDP ribazoletransferase